MMSAKSIYESIMKMIHLKEANLTQNQYLRVVLLQYEQFEVTEIGRIADDYMFFTINSQKGVSTTLLLPPTSHPIRLDVLTASEIEAPKKRRTVGFLGDVSASR